MQIAAKVVSSAAGHEVTVRTGPTSQSLAIARKLGAKVHSPASRGGS
jgi:hypothetical protein